MPKFPVGFSESPASIRSLPPHLGQDSVEILREFGLADDEIQAMLDSVRHARGRFVREL